MQFRDRLIIQRTYTFLEQHDYLKNPFLALQKLLLASLLLLLLLVVCFPLCGEKIEAVACEFSYVSCPMASVLVLCFPLRGRVFEI